MLNLTNAASAYAGIYTHTYAQGQNQEILDEAARSFMLFGAVIGAFCIGIVAATIARIVIRNRERKTDQAWEIENLFLPEDVADIQRRIQLAEAASRSELEREAFETLYELANTGAEVAAVAADLEWAQNGGRRRVVTVVFTDTTTFRFAMSPEVKPDELKPGARLISLDEAPSGGLVLRFRTPKAYITLEILAAEISNTPNPNT